MSEEILVKEEEVTSSENVCEVTEKKKRPLWILVAVSAVIILLVGVLTVMFLRTFGIINPYERDYIDVTGRTAGDIAKEKHYKYEKFLKEYGLPEDMPKNTFERAVFYNIPVKKFIEKTPGVDSFEQLKADMGWDDSITEDTTMGDALDSTKLSYYVGEEQLERFKALYELGDDVTGDTLYIEVRNIVDEKDKEFHQAELAEMESEVTEKSEALEED